MVAQISRNYFTEDLVPTNHRSSDRIFVLELMPDADMRKVDTRLVRGENRLHAVKNPAMSIWSFKLDHGMLPEPLKCSFTSFGGAKKHVEAYYLKRGVKVTEVID